MGMLKLGLLYFASERKVFSACSKRLLMAKRDGFCTSVSRSEWPWVFTDYSLNMLLFTVIASVPYSLIIKSASLL